MQWICNHAKEVYIPKDKTLTIRLVNVRNSAGDQGSCEGYFPMSWTPIVGEGDVIVGSSTKAFRLEVESNANACTGTISVDSTQANSSLFFEDGANWAGKVVWDGKVSVGKSVWTDKSSGAEYMTPSKDKSNEPFEVSFGAVELRVPMTLRLWGGALFTNDKVNITGEGWIAPEGVANVYLDFAAQDGYEVVSGDRWMIGTMPVGQTLPQTSDLKWQLVTEPIDGDENYVNVFVQFGTLEYVFNSTDVTDMNDPNAWNLKSVPKEDDAVTIAGTDVVAEMTAATPNFASITVKDGAALGVSSARTLNPISVEAGAGLTIGVKTTSISMSGFITKEETLLAENVATVDLSTLSYSAVTLGTAMPASKPFDAAYVVKNGDGSVTVQFQKADDVYTKAVLVRFELRDGSLYAKGIEGRYKSGTDKVGTDLSNGTTYTFAENATTKGYGAQDVVITAPNDTPLGRGGTVKTNGLTAFGEEGVVTLDIEADNVLDLSEASIDAQVRIVKTGAGTLVLDAVIPTNLEITEGSIGLLPEKEYDLSGVTIAPGVTYMAKTSTGVQPGYPVEKEGKVILKALGTFIGSGVWSDSANWAGGVIPGVGQTAFITQGSSVVIDTAIAVLGSIEMEDDTMLSVLADATLPTFKLAPTAKVLIGNNVDTFNVSLAAAPEASFGLVNEEVVIPTFSIATNVVLTVPGNTYFKNLDMTICGKVTTPTANCGMVRFGYAAQGETSYFKLVCDNAEIRPLVNQSNDGGAIGIVYPEVGGTVIPLADIVMKSTKFNSCGGWQEWRNTYFGFNNPADVDFNVIWDDTLLECSWGTKVGGAAHMFFRNKSYIRYNSACINHGAGDFQVTDSATMVFEDATTSFEYCQSGRNINLSPTAEGFEQVFFKNGAQLIQNGFTGNKKAIVTFAGGDVVIPDNYRQYDVLNNVGSVAIAKDTWLTIKGSHQGQGDDWDRVIKFTNAPITGEGSLVVTNTAVGKLMDVTIVNGANTATGLAMAAADDGTYLRFANGANWAGTVVANGHVAITNLTDGAAATSVTFGNLKLASGEFPIRLFKSKTGKLTADTVNLTGAIVREEGDTGVIRLVGAELENGDKVNLGTAMAGAWAKAVVKTATGHPVKIVESKPDEHGLVKATARIATGLMITIL